MRLSYLLSTYLLLATYGVIALVGYGLHGLAPHAGHHHGLQVVECSDHCSHTADDTCPFEQRRQHRAAELEATCCNGHAALHSNRHDDSAHLCSICVLLDQIRNVQSQGTVTYFWQPVISKSGPQTPPAIYAEPVLTLYAPRGPPLSIA